MVTLIVFAILAIVVAGITFVWWLDEDMPGTGFGLGALFSVLVAVVGFVVSAAITANTADLTPVMTEESEIRALDTGTDGAGRFFLGSGYTESGPSYTYLTVREDGGFEMKSIATEDAVVYQTNDSAPRVVTGQVRPTSMTWSILPLHAKTEFYVPVGSVQEPTYSVDVTR